MEHAPNMEPVAESVPNQESHEAAMQEVLNRYEEQLEATQTPDTFVSGGREYQATGPEDMVVAEAAHKVRVATELRDAVRTEDTYHTEKAVGYLLTILEQQEALARDIAAFSQEYPEAATRLLVGDTTLAAIRDQAESLWNARAANDDTYNDEAYAA